MTTPKPRLRRGPTTPPPKVRPSRSWNTAPHGHLAPSELDVAYPVDFVAGAPGAPTATHCLWQESAFLAAFGDMAHSMPPRRRLLAGGRSRRKEDRVWCDERL